MLNQLIRYFDLQSVHRPLAAQGQGAAPHAPVLPQYLVVSLGIVVEPLLWDYIASGSWHFDWSALLGR